MAKISKEQQWYLDGMSFALRIAKSGGIEALEKEISFRGLNSVPLNVSQYELIQVTRIRAHEELKIVATAMADTKSNDMKLPPSIILDYLRKFNRKVDIFRFDTDALEKTQAKINSLYALNETIKRFNKED